MVCEQVVPKWHSPGACNACVRACILCSYVLVESLHKSPNEFAHLLKSSKNDVRPHTEFSAMICGNLHAILIKIDRQIDVFRRNIRILIL